MSAVVGEEARARAWATAARHGRIVGALRIAVPAAALALVVAPPALRLFGPPASQAATAAAIAPGFSGDAMVMAAPQLSGFGEDGRKFSLDAASATQRPEAPGRVGLARVSARLFGPDGAATRVTAPNGLYDGSRKSLDLSGPVHLANPDYSIDAHGASVDFARNAVAASGGATLTLKAGAIVADSLRTAPGGVVTLVGRVRSSFSTADESGAAK